MNAGPDQTICGGCTTLTATVQGTLSTTSYTVSSIPYTPFSYNSGTPVLVGIDDEWSSVITLPFCFEFFGTSYTQVVLGSNATISFDIANANQYNTWPISAAIPDNGVNGPDLLNCIMGPWHDIDPSVGGSMYYDLIGTAPCRKLVVSWYNIPMFSCNNLIATHQIVLYETTSIIEVYIQNKPVCSSWNGGAAIEGIQNATGTTAFAVPGRNFPTMWSAANDAYRFEPNGAPQYTVTWLDGNNQPIGTGLSVNVCPTTTTTYTAQVVNQTCAGPITVTDQVIVNVGSGNINLSTTATPATCAASNGSATATATGNGPFTYSWAPGGQTTATATGLTGGTYTVYVTDANGCQANMTIVVPSSSGITATIQSQTNVLCSNGNTGTATATANGGNGPYSYAWSPNGGNSATGTGLSAGTYTVTVTDANGCTATQTVTITGPPPVTAGTTNTYATCGVDDGTATATGGGGTGPYTYSWSNGQTTATATGLAIGSYTVTVTDVNGCTQTATTNITNLNGPTATVSGNVTITSGNSANISASGGVGYSWSPSNGLSCTTCQSPVASPTVTTQYCVTVSDQAGCSAIACLTVFVETPCPANTDMSLPNAFSPNGDGHNDFFNVQGLNSCVVTYVLRIYDRWGAKVFETTDPLTGWDGTYKGRELDPAVFVYVLDATYTNGVEVHKHGNISLVK